MLVHHSPTEDILDFKKILRSEMKIPNDKKYTVITVKSFDSILNLYHKDKEDLEAIA